jgi:hypothetical protein
MFYEAKNDECIAAGMNREKIVHLWKYEVKQPRYSWNESIVENKKIYEVWEWQILQISRRKGRAFELSGRHWIQVVCKMGGWYNYELKVQKIKTIVVYLTGPYGEIWVGLYQKSWENEKNEDARRVDWQRSLSKRYEVVRVVNDTAYGNENRKPKWVSGRPSTVKKHLVSEPTWPGHAYERWSITMNLSITHLILTAKQWMRGLQGIIIPKFPCDQDPCRRWYKPMKKIQWWISEQVRDESWGAAPIKQSVNTRDSDCSYQRARKNLSVKLDLVQLLM